MRERFRHTVAFICFLSIVSLVLFLVLYDGDMRELIKTGRLFFTTELHLNSSSGKTNESIHVAQKDPWMVEDQSSKPKTPFIGKPRWSMTVFYERNYTNPNPSVTGDRDRVVQDHYYGLPSERNHTARCKFLRERLRRNMTNSFIPERDILGNTFAVSVTRHTHLEEYPIPRLADDLFHPDLCSKFFDNHRFLACSHEYRVKGNRKIIGINQPCTDMSYVASTDCAYVDFGSRNPGVMGTLFNDTHYLDLNYYTENLDPVAISTATFVRHRKLIVGTGVVSGANSHFPIEHMPRIAYLLTVSPRDADILVEGTPIVRQMMDHLVERGLIKRDRIFYFRYLSNVIHYADRVFFANEYPHCENDDPKWMGPEYNSRARRLINPVEIPLHERKTIVWMSRSKGSPRYTINEEELLEGIRSSLVSGKHRDYSLVVFDRNMYRNFTTMLEHLRRATVVIGAHGGGMGNLAYVSECTSVFEIMYSGRTIRTPSAFYSLSIALKLDYWIVPVRTGEYHNGHTVNVKTITDMLLWVLREKEDWSNRRSGLHCWEYVKGNGDGNMNRTWIRDERLEPSPVNPPDPT